MRRNLFEEIERIHQITYGDKLLKENKGFVDDVRQGIIDYFSSNSMVNKAKYINPNINDLLNTFKKISKEGGLSIESNNTDPEYIKKIEAIQIFLILFGYDLPKGITGTFDADTINGLKELLEKIGKTQLNEDSNDILNLSKQLNVDIKPGQLGNVTDNISTIVEEIIKRFKKIRPSVKIKITAGNDQMHQKIKSYKSKHTEGNAIDLTLNPSDKNTRDEFVKVLENYKKENPNFKYINEYDNPSSHSTGGHFHIQYGGSVSNKINNYTNYYKVPAYVFDYMSTFIKNKNLNDDFLKSFITPNKPYDAKDISNWNRVVNLVIDNLEGGYYNPDMYRKNPAKFGAYKNSGETMFGLDRLKGNNESTSAGKKFWELIDKNRKLSPENWKWNYTLKDNPNLQVTLKKLVGEYIKPLYEKYSSEYLSEEASNIINSNPSLTFHFVYAVWNGSGWFKYFSKLINKNVEKGITDPVKLLEIINNARKNSNSSLIRQSGEKISQITNNIIKNLYT